MGALKLFLDAMDPRLWTLLAGAFIWLLAYLVRRYAPGLWAAAVARNPALPHLWMAAIGTLLAIKPALGKPLFQAVQEILISAVLAIVAPTGIHATLRAAFPVRYTGAGLRVANAMAARRLPPGGR